MVLPLIAAAIGAGGSIAGGLIGASAQDKANEQNYQIALMNYYQREQERREALWEAQRQEREGKLGSTDAEGNRTYFKPGVGWVTEMSAQSKELQDLYRNEELQQLNQDLPAKRQQMFKNLARQGKEENVAGGLMEAMMRGYREDPSAIVNRRNQASTEGITEGMDSALNSAMRDMIRSGSSNTGKVAADIGRSRSDQLRKAFMENSEGALQQSEDQFMTRQGNLANLYNTFASRASAMPDASYNPRNLEGNANTMMAGARSAGANASGNLLNAFAKQGGTFDYKAEPNFGLATTIAQAGTGLSSALNYYDSTRGRGNQEYANYARQTPNYYPGAPSGGAPLNTYKGNVGLF